MKIWIYFWLKLTDWLLSIWDKFMSWFIQLKELAELFVCHWWLTCWLVGKVEKIWHKSYSTPTLILSTLMNQNVIIAKKKGSLYVLYWKQLTWCVWIVWYLPPLELSLYMFHQTASTLPPQPQQQDIKDANIACFTF